MTVASAVDRNDYTGNGAASSYSYTFKIQEQDEIAVYTRSTADVETHLTLTTDFTVSGVGVQTGGTISLVNGPLASGVKITILRDLSIVQDTALAGQRQFFGSSIESGIDRLAMINQMINEAINRCIKFPRTDDPDLTSELPVSSSRASGFLVCDASGNITTTPSATGLSGYTAGSILFAASNGFPTQNNTYFNWNNTNKLLTVGIARFFAPGTGNLFIGQSAGNLTTTATYNVGIGYQALTSVTTGGFNTAMGENALQLNDVGINNTAIGSECLEFNAGAGSDNNTGVGSAALQFNTTGGGNTGIGVDALWQNTTGSFNTGVGQAAGQSTTIGQWNTSVGNSALLTNIIGNANCAFGFNCLYFATGSANTAIGYEAMQATTTGASNVAGGASTMFLNTQGAQNSAWGFNALYSNTTGSNNVALGYQAGYNSGVALQTNANSTYLGAGANASTNGLTNVTVIGYQAQATASNQVIIGNTSVTTVGIGTTGPTTRLGIRDSAANGSATHTLRMWQTGGGTGTGTRIELGYADAEASTGGISGYYDGSGPAVGFWCGASQTMTLSTGGLLGINVSPASSRVESLDTSNPQYRATYTANSVYTDFKTTSGGVLDITPTGNVVELLNGNNAQTLNIYAGFGANLSVVTVNELVVVASAATTAAVTSIPAGAIVLAVSARVTVVVPTATSFNYATTTGGTALNTAAVSTAANSTDKGTKAGAFYQSAATTVTITPTLTPSAGSGRIRLCYKYLVSTPPTS